MKIILRLFDICGYIMLVENRKKIWQNSKDSKGITEGKLYEHNYVKAEIQVERPVY